MNRNCSSRSATLRTLLAVCLTLSLLLAVPGCSITAGGGKATATAEPTAAPTAEPTPSPTPEPTPSPTPEPTPTPTPEPTPTPDPWAGFFSDTPVVEVKNPYTLKGTYLYKDQDLSVNVSVLIRNNNRENYVAEIYTRDKTFFSGPADPKNLKATKKPWYIARANKAVLGINTDYWTFTRLTMKNQKVVKTPRGVILRGGETLTEEQDNDTLAVMPDGELKIFEKGTTAQQLLDLGVKDTYSFGPLLVKDGQVNPDMKDHLVYKTINKANTRCSIGMVEPGHYFCVISRNLTYDQLAEIYIELGCKLAYNLDGGNSAAMVFMGEQVNKKIYDESLGTGQRSVTDLMCIGTSEEVPGVKDPVKGEGK